MSGYFQPVQITGPPGVKVALAVDGAFGAQQAAPVKAGMLIGRVYRFRVTGIPVNEGLEVYPTIEVINRLYPPPGAKARFPIPVDLTREELEMALKGKMVSRIVYLENPRAALRARSHCEWRKILHFGPGTHSLRTGGIRHC